MTTIWHKKLFLYGTYASYILFVLAFGGIIADAPQYLDTLNMVLKYYICAFLLIQFNPFVRVGRRDPDFDRNIAFSAGVFLLLTTTATTIASEYIGKLVQ